MMKKIDDNWIKNSDNEKIKVGTLIKGYTYSAGDYHNNPLRTPEKYLGNPKLRMGIVIDIFSNEIFKVQFWNSSALKPKNEIKANKISYEFIDSKLNQSNGVIYGNDSYCMLLQRKQIVFINKEESIIVGDLKKIQESIYSKHTREKRSAIKYIQSGKYSGQPEDQVDKIFEEWQFTKREKYLSHEKAWEKISLLYKRHKINDCVHKEYKKIKNVSKFLENKKLESSDRLLYEEFLKISLKELTYSRFISKSVKILSALKENQLEIFNKYISEDFPNSKLKITTNLVDFNNNIEKIIDSANLNNDFKISKLLFNEILDNIDILLSKIIDDFLSEFKESEEIFEHYLPNLSFVEKMISFVIKQIKQEIGKLDIESINITDIPNFDENKINQFMEKVFNSLDSIILSDIIDEEEQELLLQSLEKTDLEIDKNF